VQGNKRKEKKKCELRVEKGDYDNFGKMKTIIDLRGIILELTFEYRFSNTGGKFDKYLKSIFLS
jgi:hypothetical protein